MTKTNLLIFLCLILLILLTGIYNREVAAEEKEYSYHFYFDPFGNISVQILGDDEIEIITEQFGRYNLALQLIRNPNNYSSIYQSGLFNYASIQQSGEENKAEITQSGEGNTAVIKQNTEDSDE